MLYLFGCGSKYTSSECQLQLYVEYATIKAFYVTIMYKFSYKLLIENSFSFANVPRSLCNNFTRAVFQTRHAGSRRSFCASVALPRSRNFRRWILRCALTSTLKPRNAQEWFAPPHIPTLCTTRYAATCTWSLHSPCLSFVLSASLLHRLKNGVLSLSRVVAFSWYILQLFLSYLFDRQTQSFPLLDGKINYLSQKPDLLNKLCLFGIFMFVAGWSDFLI